MNGFEWWLDKQFQSFPFLVPPPAKVLQCADFTVQDQNTVLFVEKKIRSRQFNVDTTHVDTGSVSGQHFRQNLFHLKYNICISHTKVYLCDRGILVEEACWMVGSMELLFKLESLLTLPQLPLWTSVHTLTGSEIPQEFLTNVWITPTCWFSLQLKMWFFSLASVSITSLNTRVIMMI